MPYFSTHNPWLNQVKHSGALAIFRKTDLGKEVLTVRPRLTFAFRDFMNGWYQCDKIRDHLLSNVSVNEALVLLSRDFKIAFLLYSGRTFPDKPSERLKKNQRKFEASLRDPRCVEILKRPSFVSPKLIIPRGRLKQKETALDAGLREAHEETGINLDRIRWHVDCTAADSYYTYNGHYKISYNCATLISDDDTDDTSGGHGQMVEIGEVCWLPLTRIHELEERQQDIVRRFANWLKRRKLL